MRPIRNSVKALILENGKVLAIEKQHEDEIYYILPGGGQEPGEDFLSTLKRECGEEIGVEVEPEDLRYVREYVGRNHEFSDVDSEVHQIEFMFVCKTKKGTHVKVGEKPDEGQVGLKWIPIDELTNYPLYPKALRPVLSAMDDDAIPVYLGDIN